MNKILNKPLKINGLKDIVTKYNSFLFDLDGVVWEGNNAIPNAIQSLRYLRSQNKNLFYITNNSTRNRTEVKQKFASHGFEVKESDIYSTSYLAGIYLKQKYPQVKNVLCGGTESMAQEIASHGFNVTRLAKLSSDVQVSEIFEKHYDPKIQVIFLGFDADFSWVRANQYGIHLQHGVKFLATNGDKATIRAGFKVPGCGSMIAFLETAYGVKAQVIGKPNRYAIDYVIEENKLKREECVMIGDNLETDIMLGKNGGVDTVIVLSGVTKKEQVLENEMGIYADYYSETI